jgi:hypothetical protein
MTGHVFSERRRISGDPSSSPCHRAPLQGRPINQKTQGKPWAKFPGPPGHRNHAQHLTNFVRKDRFLSAFAGSSRASRRLPEAIAQPKKRTLSPEKTSVSSVPLRVLRASSSLRRNIASQRRGNDRICGSPSGVPGLLLHLWSWNVQPLTGQQAFCVHDVVEALGTEATVESLVPHLQLCPLATD